MVAEYKEPGGDAPNKLMSDAERGFDVSHEFVLDDAEYLRANAAHAAHCRVRLACQKCARKPSVFYG